MEAKEESVGGGSRERDSCGEKQGTSRRVVDKEPNALRYFYFLGTTHKISFI